MTLVWPDSFVGEDSLTQNIATLRKALGDVPGRPQYIVTVPRHGYRFVAPVRVEIAATIRPEDLGVASATSSEGPALDLPDEPRAAVRTAPLADGRTTMLWTRGLIALLTVTIFIVTALAIRLLPHTPAIAPQLTRFIVAPPEGTTFSPSASFLAVSPNGRRLAFLVARPGDETRLWLRSLDSLNARELTGTEGALSPSGLPTINRWGSLRMVS